MGVCHHPFRLRRGELAAEEFSDGTDGGIGIFPFGVGVAIFWMGASVVVDFLRVGGGIVFVLERAGKDGDGATG